MRNREQEQKVEDLRRRVDIDPFIYLYCTLMCVCVCVKRKLSSAMCIVQIYNIAFYVRNQACTSTLVYRVHCDRHFYDDEPISNTRCELTILRVSDVQKIRGKNGLFRVYYSRITFDEFIRGIVYYLSLYSPLFFFNVQGEMNTYFVYARHLVIFFFPRDSQLF